MARKRLVAPEFFTHGELYDAEATAGLPLRVAFAGLWTVSDRRGLFRWRPRELKLALLPYDPCDFADVLVALEAAGFIERYVVDGKEYGRIPSFSQWQTFHRNEQPSDVPEPPKPEAKPSNGRLKPSPSVTGTVAGTGTSTNILPANSAGGSGEKPEAFDFAPFAEAWFARYEGPITAEHNVVPLRWLVKKHGAAEVLRRWVIYLAATESQYASASKLKSGWGQWATQPAARGGVQINTPQQARAAALWERYKAANLLTKWERPEYERIGGTLVDAGHYATVADFLDELRVTKPWTLRDARSDGYAVNEIVTRLAQPQRVAV